MKISTNKFFNDKHSIGFKKGLTSYEIESVRRMKPNEFEDISKKLKKLYNMDTDFDGSNTVAWCVEQVADIMTKAGFKLPKCFKFLPHPEDNTLGVYNSYTDTIIINSRFNEFQI